MVGYEWFAEQLVPPKDELRESDERPYMRSFSAFVQFICRRVTMVWKTASGYDIHIDFDFGVCGTSALDGRV